VVIDTSAIVAAIANEPDGDVYRTAIKTAPVRLMSAVSLLETRIVLFSRLGSNAITTFDELIARAGIVVEPFDESLAGAAFDAFRKYGKGQSNPAQLNIVDCVVYALAAHAIFRCCSRVETSRIPISDRLFRLPCNHRGFMHGGAKSVGEMTQSMLLLRVRPVWPRISLSVVGHAGCHSVCPEFSGELFVHSRFGRSGRDSSRGFRRHS
jgi:ribonuclease VapC